MRMERKTKKKKKKRTKRDCTSFESVGKNRLTTGRGGPRVTGNLGPIVGDVYTLDIRVIILLLVTITRCTR